MPSCVLYFYCSLDRNNVVTSKNISLEVILFLASKMSQEKKEDIKCNEFIYQITCKLSICTCISSTKAKQVCAGRLRPLA